MPDGIQLPPGLSVSLKEYIEKLLANVERMITDRWETERLAREILSAEMQRRLDKLNGEAARLRQMESRYVPREVFDTRIASVDSMLAAINKVQAIAEGKASSVSVMVAWGLSIAGIVIGMVGLLTK